MWGFISSLGQISTLVGHSRVMYVPRVGHCHILVFLLSLFGVGEGNDAERFYWFGMIIKYTSNIRMKGVTFFHVFNGPVNELDINF